MKIKIPPPPPRHAPQMAVSGSHETLNTNLMLSLYYTFKTLPLLVSALSMYLGYRLFILGVTGQASLSVESKTVKGQLLNAAPGLFFAVGGVIAMIVVVWKGVSISFDATGRKELSL